MASTVLLVSRDPPSTALMDELESRGLCVEATSSRRFERTFEVVGPDLVVHVGWTGSTDVVGSLTRRAPQRPLVLVVDRDRLLQARALDRQVVASVLVSDMSVGRLAERIVDVASSAGQDPAGEDPARQAVRAPRRVALVDDDVTRADAVARALRDRGLDVQLTSGDAKATRWALLRRFEPDLFVASGEGLLSETWLALQRADAQLGRVPLRTAPYSRVFDETSGAVRLDVLLRRIGLAEGAAEPPSGAPEEGGTTAERVPGEGELDDERPTLLIGEEEDDLDGRPTVALDEDEAEGRPTVALDEDEAEGRPTVALDEDEARATAPTEGEEDRSAVVVEEDDDRPTVAMDEDDRPTVAVDAEDDRPALPIDEVVAFEPTADAVDATERDAAERDAAAERAGPRPASRRGRRAVSLLAVLLGIAALGAGTWWWRRSAVVPRPEVSPSLPAKDVVAPSAGDGGPDVPRRSEPAVEPPSTTASPWEVPESPAATPCESLVDPAEALPRGDVAQASRYWEKARSALVLGDMPEAQAWMCRAVFVFPKSLAAEGLAESYLDMGAPREAKRWIDVALEHRPDRPRTLELLGDIENQLGDVEGSRASWLRAFEVRGDVDATLALLARDQMKKGEAALRAGDLGRAEVHYRRAAVFRPESEEAPLGLARVAGAANEDDRAAQWVKEALRRNPESVGARQLEREASRR